MNKREIKCPNCGTVIQIDESTYDSIVKQIRDEEFNSELNRQKSDAIKLAKAETESNMKDLISKKEERIAELSNKLASLEKELSSKDDIYKALLDKANSEKALELNKLNSENKETINNLNSQIQLLNEQFKSKQESIKQDYETQLRVKQEEVDFYKDFKAKQSTKAIGEDLEHYCENTFNKSLRPILPHCYFEKDNEVSKASGSKGDFIFKDYDEEGTEIVSVMIECKNEADETEHKHKNEYFFKELDKDRTEKKCEYAVLCSMLEEDNDLYNDGIVDVSYKYDKMYVVRPQQLIPLLTLLRNASIKSLGYKKELILAQSQSVDITNFEENMNTFKEGFSKNYDLASKKFKSAIDEIDKTIDHLQKTKDALLSSENNLRLANNKAQDLSIKKLTKNAPSVAEKFGL